jgi:hypothetical protein
VPSPGCNYSVATVRSRMAGSTRRPRVALLGLGYMLLVCAWIVATPPFGAPDEASHYDRAVGLNGGVILGRTVPYGPDPELTPTQRAFINHDTRAVWVPAGFMPSDVLCIGSKPDIRGCDVATPNGNFPPLGYVLPAVAIRVSDNVTTAMWLTRAASALQSTGFLLLAAALLWAQSGWSLVGLLAAVTPMVLFASSIMNTSGVEIASSLAFTAAVLRISRAPAHASPWVWGAFALAGAVAILTGPIGLVFALGDLLLFAALLGPRELGALSRTRGPLVCAAVLGAAAVISLTYSRVAGFSEKFGVSPVGQSLHHGIDQLGPVLKDAVGHFGALTVPLPFPAVALWWLLIAFLVIWALWLSTRRDRLILGAVVVLALAFPVLFWAWIDRYTGFGLQGREVLPPILLIPLVAGELIFRNSPVWADRRWARLTFGGIVAIVAVFQAYAWWISARAAAGAPGTLRFYAHATWSPPLGWAPWIAAALLGTLALLAFAAGEVLGRPPGLESRTAFARRATSAPGRA